MKKKLISIVLLSIVILTGCSNGKSGNNVSAGGTEQRIEVKTDFKAIQPNTIPSLSEKQKTEVDLKLNPALNNIDKTLKSLEDAKEIDLSTLD